MLIKLFEAISTNVFLSFSWLRKIPGFSFDCAARDPSYLPKEYTASEGETCYFLDGYTHAGLDRNFSIQRHIEVAMKQINAEMKK